MSRLDVVYENETIVIVETGLPGPAGPSNRITESAGPTHLQVGAIADGEYLRRVGSTVVGAAGGGGGGIDVGAGTEAELLQINAAGTTPARAGYTIASLLAAARDRATHTGQQLASTISDFAAAVGALLTWSAISGKPSSFPPDTHTHPATDISDSTTAGRALLTAADAAAQRSALSLGTAAQAATGDFEPAGAVSTHNATAGAHGISTFGASLIDDADAAAARTTLGLGTAATAATSDFATAAQGTDARTPTAHAASHATAGSDALTPSDIGAQATLVSGTNIKTINSTSILGSGDLAISATPAGSGTELQYRNGSSFGAVAGTSWASNQLLITAQSASATPMAVRAAASQSANIFEWQGSTGTVLAAVRESGGTGFFRARRFEFSDDPTNRHISSQTWISNLAIELATSTNNAAISVATGNNDNYRVFFHADTVNLRPQVLSQLGRSILFGAANADAVANRPVGEALLSGASCNAAGQSISGGAVVGGAARVLGGNGASGATTAAANGGDVYITPGIGYGTGRHGLAILPISRVPTSDPGVPGAIWNDSGTLKISP